MTAEKFKTQAQISSPARDSSEDMIFSSQRESPNTQNSILTAFPCAQPRDDLQEQEGDDEISEFSEDREQGGKVDDLIEDFSSPQDYSMDTTPSGREVADKVFSTASKEVLEHQRRQRSASRDGDGRRQFPAKTPGADVARKTNRQKKEDSKAFREALGKLLWPTEESVKAFCDISHRDPKESRFNLATKVLEKPACVQLLNEWKEKNGMENWQTAPGFKSFQFEMARACDTELSRYMREKAAKHHLGKGLEQEIDISETKKT